MNNSLCNLHCLKFIVPQIDTEKLVGNKAIQLIVLVYSSDERSFTEALRVK